MSDQWESTYKSKQASERSWTQAVPKESLELLDLSDLRLDDPIIEIGGGSSVFVDVLISREYSDITVLDISQIAIEESRARVGSVFGDRASGKYSVVEWIVADLTRFSPTRTYALWHDRVVFHFLVEPSDQARYVKTATDAVRPGGSLILATFSPEGPETCSGLPVRRWSPGELATLFGAEFDAVEQFRRDHHTPWGSTQSFTWILMRRR